MIDEQHGLMALNTPENIAQREPTEWEMRFFSVIEAAAGMWGQEGEEKRVWKVNGNTVSSLLDPGVKTSLLTINCATSTLPFLFPFDPPTPLQRPTPIPAILLPLRWRTLPRRPGILARLLLLAHIHKPESSIHYTLTPHVSANTSRQIHPLGRGWVARRPWV